MIVFAFDRDHTVDSSPDPGPVPLAWVKWLGTQSGIEVWAVGNQKLKGEAGIPGVDEMRVRLGIPKKKAGSAFKDRNNTLDRRTRNVNSKIKRLKFLAQMFPAAERLIVVDDFDLSRADGWEYYDPDEFMRVVFPQFPRP